MISPFSSLDLKLGLRMLRKYPGVSLVIAFALAVGIPVSLVPNHLIDAATDEPPPFHEGERVLGVVGEGQEGRTDLRLADYERLRGRLETLASVGAAIPLEVNVISGDGSSEGESGALLTASIFALSRVPPLMGRALLPADEAQGASEVVVVGHGFWRKRLGGAPNVVGTTLRIAGVPTTIVGVMPEGFAMPSTEQLWLPLRLRSADYTDGLGPPVWMYGRLADGVSPTQARAEVEAINLPTAPGIRTDPIHAKVVPFSAVDVQMPAGGVVGVLFAIAQAMPVVLLLIACGNAGILILARTATRSGEIAVRTVLGASRVRIMGQMFAETLVLAVLATGAGLIVIDVVVERVAPRFTLPFWFDPALTPAFVIKALGVSVLCAIVAGVLPARRATSGALQTAIQTAGTGGGTLRLGRVAGALIIVEVALGIAALFAGGMFWQLFQPNPDRYTRAADPGRYLVASIRIPQSALDRPGAAQEGEALRIRLATLQEELGRRLASQPAVRRWTFSDQPPGEERDERLVRIDGDGLAPDDLGRVGVATFVDPGFFALLNVSPVAGRLFSAADVPVDPTGAPASAIVNMKFLERRAMQPQAAVGARMRFTGERNGTPGPWMEIIGVVPNIEPSADQVFADGTPVVFLPAAPGGFNPLTLTIDMGADPLSFAPRLRSLVAEADPTALLEEISTLDDLPGQANVFGIAIGVMTGISVLAIVLSTTALYALMSMTVAQRRREIGIRLALGGSAGGVMTTVARRALVQIAVGMVLGVSFWVGILGFLIDGGELERTVTAWPFMLALSAAMVISIGLAASLGPVVKYIRMRPVETLRVDG